MMQAVISEAKRVRVQDRMRGGFVDGGLIKGFGVRVRYSMRVGMWVRMRVRVRVRRG